jgi:hypothetical protein
VPLSPTAREAVRVVAARNPPGAQTLLDMMRTAPEVARRKPTRFGPLSIALHGQPPLSPAEARLCEAFGEEWLRGEFDIHELADAVEAELARVTGRSQDRRRQRPDVWRTLAGPQQETGRLFGPTRPDPG